MVFEIKEITLLKEVNAGGCFSVNSIFARRGIRPEHDNLPIIDIEEIQKQNPLYTLELIDDSIHYTIKDDWMEMPRKLTLTIRFKYPVRWWAGQ
ncbi:hypothetical protein D3C76_345530 [compost metagenome]